MLNDKKPNENMNDEIPECRPRSTDHTPPSQAAGNTHNEAEANLTQLEQPAVRIAAEEPAENAAADLDESNSDQEDSDEESSGEEGSDEEDSDEEDSDKEDSDEEDSDKEDSDKEDSDKEDLDEEDSNKEDFYEYDSDDSDCDPIFQEFLIQSMLNFEEAASNYVASSGKKRIKDKASSEEAAAHVDERRVESDVELLAPSAVEVAASGDEHTEMENQNEHEIKSEGKKKISQEEIRREEKIKREYAEQIARQVRLKEKRREEERKLREFIDRLEYMGRPKEHAVLQNKDDETDSRPNEVDRIEPIPETVSRSNEVDRIEPIPETVSRSNGIERILPIPPISVSLDGIDQIETIPATVSGSNEIDPIEPTLATVSGLKTIDRINPVLETYSNANLNTASDMDLLDTLEDSSADTTLYSSESSVAGDDDE